MTLNEFSQFCDCTNGRDGDKEWWKKQTYTLKDIINSLCTYQQRNTPRASQSGEVSFYS